MSTNAYITPCKLHPNCVIHGSGAHIQAKGNDLVATHPDINSGIVKSAQPKKPIDKDSLDLIEKDNFEMGQPPDMDTECWLWARAMYPHGYGCLWFNGRPAYAHRVIYEALVGVVPEGLELDHLCRVRACVNPEHLEPVTHQENVARGLKFTRITHCKNGHELTKDNCDFSRGRRGVLQRQCRECSLIRKRKYYHANKPKKLRGGE